MKSTHRAVRCRATVVLLSLAPTTAIVGVACRQVLGLDDIPPETAPHVARDGGDAGDAGNAADADADASIESPFKVFNGVPGDGEALVGIWGTGPDFFVAVGTSSVSYVYKSGTLTRLGGAIKGRDSLAVWGFSETDIFAVGQDGNGGGFVDHFDGKSWTLVFQTNTPLLGVWGSPEGKSAVLAVGTEGKIFGWSPGQSWGQKATLPKAPNDPQTSGTPRLWSISGRNLEDFSIAADSRLYHYEPDAAGGFAYYEATSLPGTFFRAVWQAPQVQTSIYLGTNFYGLDWFAANPANGYAVSLLFRDEATGGADQAYIEGVWGTPERVVAVGDHGRIYAYDIGLATIVPIESPTDEALAGVWGSSLDDIWIVGGRELILHGSLH